MCMKYIISIKGKSGRGRSSSSFVAKAINSMVDFGHKMTPETAVRHEDATDSGVL